MKSIWLKHISSLCAVAAAGVMTAHAEEADRSAYTLLNPTPRDAMREMSTDRPDRTESPFTIDAGHYQLEMDVLNYSYDRYNPEKSRTRVHTYNVAPLNLRVGVLHNLELDLIVEPFIYRRTEERGMRRVDERSGFGNITPRLKYNFWGNNGGSTALGIMPFVKIPTHSGDLDNGDVEGGVILPFSAELPGQFGLGMMTEVDLRRDGRGSGYHAEFINSVVVSRSICGALGGYVEFFSLVSEEAGSGWVGTVDFGFTYELSKDVQLDAGVNIGVTRAADDWNPFLGISWRF